MLCGHAPHIEYCTLRRSAYNIEASKVAFGQNEIVNIRTSDPCEKDGT